jgi:hypothetical protein
MRLNIGFAAGLCLAGIVAETATSAPAIRRQAPAHPLLATLAEAPLYFEANAGQTAPEARFLARAGDCQILIAPDSAQLVLREDEPSAEMPQGLSCGQHFARSIRVDFPGASPTAAIQALAKTPAKVNYLLGPDAARWHTGVETFARVQVRGLYPGVDLVYYGNQHRLEYDFSLAPGIHPGTVQMRFAGADQLSINAGGDLVLRAGSKEICQPRPVIYQVADGKRRSVAGGYRLVDGQTVAFEVGAYDPSRPLVIDPVLVYSSYLGGDASTQANAIKVDAAGSVYVAGTTFSFLMPFEPPPLQLTNVAAIGTNGIGTNAPFRGRFYGDAFVAKFDSTLTNLIFFTYLGGTNDDAALAVDVDSSSRVYLTGWTASTNFPVTSNGIAGLSSSTHISGTQYHITGAKGAYPLDAYVARLSPSGATLDFSGYLGGTLEDVGVSLALDAENAIYVAGYTTSTNFPVTNAFQPELGNRRASLQGAATNTINAFLAKLAPDATNLSYSTYLGGDGFTYLNCLAIDKAGFAWIGGSTISTNFPTTADALQPGVNLNRSTNAVRQYNGPVYIPCDGYVARFDASRSGAASLLYSSLLGGTNSDAVYALATDAQASDSATNVYAAGYTFSYDFPGAQRAAGLFFAVSTNRSKVRTNSDAFLTRFDGMVTNGRPPIAYSLLFGSTNNDTATCLAVAPGSGIVYVAGNTFSTNFPTTNTFQFLAHTNAGVQDCFLAAFAETNAHADGRPDTLFSAYLGGSGNDFASSLAADASGNAYLAGQTYSPDFPEVQPFSPPMQRTNNAFLAKVQLTNQVITVTIATSPLTNLLVVIDNVTNRAPVTTNWFAGSKHSISVRPVQGGFGTNQVPAVTNLYTQLAWDSWSHGGMLSNTIYPTSDSTYTASFTTQYYLAVTTTNGGGVNLASGWYNAGTNLNLLATPGYGTTFDHWSGAGTNAYSGTANPVAITLDGPLNQAAVFSGAASARLVVVTNGLGSVTPDLTAQTLVSGKSYTVKAVPAAGYLFAGWTGGKATNTAAIGFVMSDGLVLVANFVTNTYLPAAGKYAGLFYDPQNFDEDSSGYFTASVTTLGKLSARLKFAGQSYSFSGQLPASGYGYYSIKRSSNTNITHLTVALQLDPLTGQAIDGQVSDGTWTAQIYSFRAAYSATNSPPQHGQRFMYAIPANAQYLTRPGGTGYGYVNVGNSGTISMSSTLGDGVKCSQSTYLSTQSQWPMFASLYGGRGSILGWLTLTNQVTNDITGQISWYKPSRPYDRYYGGGFTVETNILGSLYSAPSNNARILAITNGQVVLQTGDLPRSLTNLIALGDKNVVADLGTNRLKLTFTPSSGLFSGSFRSFYKGRTWSFSGAVLQKQNYAAGYFKGTNRTGTILIQPK